MTSLQRQNISLPFNRGVDTKSDVKLVEPPMLTNLQNGVFTRGGSIKKRNGTVSLSQGVTDGSSITVGSALAVFNDELLAFDDTSAYSYSSTNQQWLSKGAALSIKTAKQRIISNAAEQTDQDMVIYGNVALFAWKDSRGGIRASVIDLQTDVFYQADVEISATGTNPRCFRTGSRLFVMYADGTGLKARRTEAGLPTSFVAENTLITNLNATKLFDVVTYSATGAAFAYSTDTNEVRIGFCTQNGFLGVTGNGFPMPITVAENAANCLTIITDATPDKLYVAYHNGTAGVRAFSRNADLTQNFAPVTVDATTSTIRNVTGAFTTTSSITWFYELDAALDYNQRVISNTLTTTGTAGTAASFKRSVGLASKAWTQNSRAYVNCIHDSTLQATYFTFDHSGLMVAKHLGAIAGGLTVSAQLPRVEALSTGIYVWAALEKGILRSDSATVFSLRGVTMLTADFTYNSRFITAQLGQNLHVVGGALQSYDGNQLIEHGFHVFPENLSSVSSNGPGSIANGTYGYRAVYEWTDAQGQIHQSAPSDILTVTLAGVNDTVDLTVPTLRLTGKSRVVVAIYRSTTGNSTTFYRITSISSPLLNDAAVDSVAFQDTFADASITSNQILYTVGGVLDNDAPPSATAIVAGKRRLFVLAAEDGAIWYSKQTVIGQGAAFSLAQQVVRQDVKPTALAILDDKVIVFEPHRIFAFAGDGPNTLGQQDSFSPLELIQTDVGCSNPASIVRTSLGIMFQSAKGIYLLDRALQASYIGAAVEAYNAETVTSGTLIEGTNEVRFTTEASRTLVYDYLFGQWSTWTSYSAEDSAMWRGTFVSLRSDGKVKQESATVFTDDGNTYELLIETAWIKLAGLQGFQRLRKMALLGDVYSAHTLVTEIAYDYQEYYTDTLSFVTNTAIPPAYYGDDSTYGSGALYGSASDIVYQFRASMPRQKMQAVRFKFRDDAATGQSYALTGLDLEVAVKRGLNKLRSAKTL